MKEAFVDVPQLGGKTMSLLSEARERELISEIEMSASPCFFSLRDRGECSLAALGLLLYHNLARHAGSGADQQSVADLCGRLLGKLSRAEVMQLEIEAFEMLEWAGKVLRGEEIEKGSVSADIPALGAGRDFLTILRAAIDGEYDLTMWYYTGGRGEYGSRRISPIRIEADKFLIAYCHKRAAERVFRISRIARLIRESG